MDRTAFGKKNGKYFLKYLKAESYYKSSLLLECILHYRQMLKGNLLDLGCGNKPYYDIYSETCASSIRCDVPFSLHNESEVEIICMAEEIDKHFREDSFDSILCTEVLEHTADDSTVIKNVSSILKTDGFLILSAPFIYVLHEAPFDYRRYTFYGMKKILEDNKFQIIGAHSLGATLSSGFLIYYYSFLKTFYFIFKKIGFKDLHKITFIRAILNLPEFILLKLNISRFRKKLRNNDLPSVNEMFASTGYFFAARKL